MSGEALENAELFLRELAAVVPQEVTVGGRVLRPGGRVRLKPAPGVDVLDAALAGKVAVIEGIEEDDAGRPHVAVLLEDDPGRDLGALRHPAHRFFFAPHELEPLAEEGAAPARRVLVAGIGNVFFGDDGFGVAVARRLMGRQVAAGVEVADFGIRGIDLAYQLGGGYDAAVLVDAVPRGGGPGSLYLIDPDAADWETVPPLDSHQMQPLAVLGLARQLGALPPRLYIVGCEPAPVDGEREESMSAELSPPVAAAVERAAELVAELASRLAAGDQEPEEAQEKRRLS